MAPALAVNIGPVLLAYVLFSSAYIYVENTLKKGIVPAVTSLCLGIPEPIGVLGRGACRGHALAFHF